MIKDMQSLLQQYHAGKPLKYVFFWGHQSPKSGEIGKSCFSQWYEAAFEIDGVRYISAEHYMMASKAKLFGDTTALAKILTTSNPAAAKRYGREVVGFVPEIWETERYRIVVDANFGKFSQNPPLSDFLLATSDRILVEASPVDSIWGIGLSQDQVGIENPENWQGLNLLGFALMDVRAALSPRKDIDEIAYP